MFGQKGEKNMEKGIFVLYPYEYEAHLS